MAVPNRFSWWGVSLLYLRMGTNSIPETQYLYCFKQKVMDKVQDINYYKKFACPCAYITVVSPSENANSLLRCSPWTKCSLKLNHHHHHHHHHHKGWFSVIQTNMLCCTSDLSSVLTETHGLSEISNESRLLTWTDCNGHYWLNSGLPTLTCHEVKNKGWQHHEEQVAKTTEYSVPPTRLSQLCTTWYDPQPCHTCSEQKVPVHAMSST